MISGRLAVHLGPLLFLETSYSRRRGRTPSAMHVPNFHLPAVVAALYPMMHVDATKEQEDLPFAEGALHDRSVGLLDAAWAYMSVCNRT